MVDKINSETSKTGVTAAVSGTGAILLTKQDGNEISLKISVLLRAMSQLGKLMNLEKPFRQLHPPYLRVIILFRVDKLILKVLALSILLTIRKPKQV